jgi:hypothetical protein
MPSLKCNSPRPDSSLSLSILSPLSLPSYIPTLSKAKSTSDALLLPMHARVIALNCAALPRWPTHTLLHADNILQHDQTPHSIPRHFPRHFPRHPRKPLLLTALFDTSLSLLHLKAVSRVPFLPNQMLRLSILSFKFERLRHARSGFEELLLFLAIATSTPYVSGSRNRYKNTIECGSLSRHHHFRTLKVQIFS